MGEYNWPAFGQIAYESFCMESKLPSDWNGLPPEAQLAWIESAKTVIDYFSRAVLA